MCASPRRVREVGDGRGPKTRSAARSEPGLNRRHGRARSGRLGPFSGRRDDALVPMTLDTTVTTGHFGGPAAHRGFLDFRLGCQDPTLVVRA